MKALIVSFVVITIIAALDIRVKADGINLPPPVYAAPPIPAQQKLQKLDCQCFDLPLSQYTAPADNPAPPGDAFTTNFTGTLSPTSPVIADFTKQAAPGDAVVLQGSGFSATSQVVCYSGGVTSTLTPLQAVPAGAPQTLTFRLPSGGAYGMTLAWVQNPDGSTSAPVRINATQVWWTSQENVGSGAALSLFGRNLSYGNGTTTSHVYIRAADGTAVTGSCTVTSVSPYRVDAKLPNGLVATKDYELWVHNGHGGAYGWSGPMRITIVAPDPNWGWVAATSALRPSSDLQTALNSTAAGHTLLLGPGTFTITGSLTIPKGVQLAGNSQTDTVIQLDPGYVGGGNVITMTPGDTRICDLTINTNGNEFKSIISANGKQAMPKGVWIDRVTINYPCPPVGGTSPDGKSVSVQDGYIDDAAIDIRGCEQTEVSACTVTAGRALFLYRVNGSNITSNHFNGNLPGQTSFGTLVSDFASRNLIISGNRFASVNRTVGASQVARRALMVQDIDGVATNLYVAKNSTTGIGPMMGSSTGTIGQNVGETFCWESAGQPLAVFTGTQTTYSSPTSFSFPTGTLTAGILVTDDLTQYKSSVVAVNSGPGAGQWRRILSNTANTMTIDRPWDVVPSGSDTLLVEQASSRSIVYDNTVYFEPDENNNGINDNFEFTRASVGCEFWGDVLDSDIVGNIFQGTRTGIFNAGRYNSDTIEPQVGIIVSGNTVVDNLYGIFEGPYISQQCVPATPGPDGPVLRNIMVRGNTVDTPKYPNAIGIYLDQSALDFKWYWGGWGENTVLDMNTVTLETGTSTGTSTAISSNLKGAYTQDTLTLTPP